MFESQSIAVRVHGTRAQILFALYETIGPVSIAIVAMF